MTRSPLPSAIEEATPATSSTHLPLSMKWKVAMSRPSTLKPHGADRIDRQNSVLSKRAAPTISLIGSTTPWALIRRIAARSSARVSAVSNRLEVRLERLGGAAQVLAPDHPDERPHQHEPPARDHLELVIDLCTVGDRGEGEAVAAAQRLDVGHQADAAVALELLQLLLGGAEAGDLELEAGALAGRRVAEL